MGTSITDEKSPSGTQTIRHPTVEEVLADIENDTAIPTDAVDAVYGRKAAVLNRAIKDIGMGWYQWQLFIVVGFGWASDNLWPVVTSLIFVSILNWSTPGCSSFSSRSHLTSNLTF